MEGCQKRRSQDDRSKVQVTEGESVKEWSGKYVNKEEVYYYRLCSSKAASRRPSVQALQSEDKQEQRCGWCDGGLAQRCAAARQDLVRFFSASRTSKHLDQSDLHFALDCQIDGLEQAQVPLFMQRTRKLVVQEQRTAVVVHDGPRY
jgi:hypothetical protein